MRIITTSDDNHMHCIKVVVLLDQALYTSLEPGQDGPWQGKV